MSDSERMQILYEEDQEDRKKHPLDWAVIGERDRRRRSEVRSLLDRGLLQTARDYFCAAVIYMHGLDSSDYEIARSLAQKAGEIDPSCLASKEMLAAAQDRYLLSMGSPQWYGTQKMLKGGRVVLAPVDPEAVTDEQRRSLGVLTLEERQAEVEQINRLMAKRRPWSPHT